MKYLAEHSHLTPRFTLLFSSEKFKLFFRDHAFSDVTDELKLKILWMLVYFRHCDRFLESPTNPEHNVDFERLLHEREVDHPSNNQQVGSDSDTSVPKPHLIIQDDDNDDDDDKEEKDCHLLIGGGDNNDTDDAKKEDEKMEDEVFGAETDDKDEVEGEEERVDDNDKEELEVEKDDDNDDDIERAIFNLQ
jgi:hypothetical protein